MPKKILILCATLWLLTCIVYYSDAAEISDFVDPDLQISKVPSPFSYACSTDWVEGARYVMETLSTMDAVVTNRRLCSTSTVPKIYGEAVGGWEAVVHKGEKGWLLRADQTFMSVEDLHSRFPAHDTFAPRNFLKWDHCK